MLGISMDGVDGVVVCFEVGCVLVVFVEVFVGFV